MKKYYLGELKTGKGEKDKIYYDLKKEEFIAIKQDGKERNLSKKQKEYLHKKFHTKCSWLKRKNYITSILIGLVIPPTIWCCYLSKYKNLLEDLPKVEKKYCFDENILNKERDIEFLIEMCNKYIDKNESFTAEQKEYLKLKWSKYLEDNGYLFERKAILEMLENLSTVPIEYVPYKNNILASHFDSPHRITLSPYATNVDLLHEIGHCAMGERLPYEFISLEEGYCEAIVGKYSNVLTYYKAENEYLLLISEIIGKENLKWCIINGEEDKLVNELAKKTHTSDKEIKDLISKMYDSLREDNQYGSNLCVEIKMELAKLAIKADEKNKENFIVLNAYYGKFDLDTSFLEDKYFFIVKEQTDKFKKYAYFSDEMKYNYADLFEEESTLKKEKTNE